MTVGPTRLADQAGLDAVGGQRAHQLLAGGVDLALVLAQLLGLRAAGPGRAAPTPPGPGLRRHRAAAGARADVHRRGRGVGLERDVDVGVVVDVRRLVGMR